MRNLTILRAATSVAGVAGFIAQMLLHSDPTPGYAYFSPDVALLLGLVTGMALFSSSWRVTPAAIWLSHAATTGIVLATAVYWFALVPVNGLPSAEDPAAVVAALLIHGVLPAVAIPLYLTDGAQRGRSLRWVWSAALLLAAYGVVLFAICAARNQALPYEFIDPAIVGPGLAILFSSLSLVVYGAIGWALHRAAARHSRIRPVGHPEPARANAE